MHIIHILHILHICVQMKHIQYILHILHIHLTYVPQNRALLDTLRLHQSNNNMGHICIFSTLLIGHTEHPGHMRVSSLLFVPKQMHSTNHQDMVFILPPGISNGAFQLRMDNIWFCKLLLLFKISTMTDAGIKPSGNLTTLDM